MIMRGMDNRDMVKCMREQTRFNNEFMAKTDFRRPHAFKSMYQKPSNMPVPKPVVSARGGDLKDIVKQGREKAQFNKAVSPFTQTTIPNKMKIGGGYIL